MRVHGPIGVDGAHAQQVVVKVPNLDQEGIVLEFLAMDMGRRQ